MFLQAWLFGHWSSLSRLVQVVLEYKKRNYYMFLRFTDVNECLINDGGCEHMCNNTPGSYECICRGGYQLESDGKACQGETILGMHKGNMIS